MSKRLLSRREYDIRFLEFSDSVPAGKLGDRIEEEIHQVYPGNNDGYLHFTRPWAKDSYITAIVKKEVIGQYTGDKIYIPALLLPEILKKSGKSKYGTLVIWAGDIGELISFNSEGAPVSSRLLESPPPEPGAKWVLVSKPKIELDIPDGALLFSRPMSPARGRIEVRKQRKGGSGHLGMVILLFLISMGLVLSLKLYTDVQKKNIRRFREQQTINQTGAMEIQELEEEILNLEKSLNLVTREENPYLLLSALYTAGDPSFRMRRISIQKGAFTLEGRSNDPVAFSGRLSESETLSDINILRIQEFEGAFLFSLKGQFNE